MDQKTLTLQLHHHGAWHDAGTVALYDLDAGVAGRTRVAYDLGYFAELGAVPLHEGRPLRGIEALSVRLPVSLDDVSEKTWPPFLLDVLPQGHARRKIAEHLGLDAEAPSSEPALLERTGAAPIGNVRVKEAYVEAMARLEDQVYREDRARNEAGAWFGLPMDEILARSDRFRDLADRFAFIASGSSGLQGEWPKVALTQAVDGLWYPDPLVADEQARGHVIVKLVGSRDRADELILEAEAGYARVAREIGADVAALPEYRAGALVIPRFDRAVTNSGVRRHGQESLVSAIGVARFGHLDTHERYLAAIQEHSDDPLADTIEYLLREVLNQAMGNPDNHGRNNALQKREVGDAPRIGDGLRIGDGPRIGDGQRVDDEWRRRPETRVQGIRLAPLFDFAPMRLAANTIARSSKWACLRDLGRDHDPDWATVCEAAAGDRLEPRDLMEALLEKEPLIRQIPQIARRHGVPEEVIERACNRHLEIADGIAELHTWVPDRSGPSSRSGPSREGMG